MELLSYWTYFSFDTYESRLRSGPHLPSEGETVFPRAHASPALSHGPLTAGGHRQDRDSRYEQTADAWWLSGDLVVVTPAVTRSKSFAWRWSAMRGSVVVYPRAQFGYVTGGERSRVRGGSMIADSENGSFSGTRNGRSEATSLVCSY